MSTEINSSNAVSKAFLAAYIVTGSSSCSELIVQSAIEHLSPRDSYFRALIIESFRLGVELSRRPELNFDRSGPAVELPSELAGVLQLPSPMRNVFVARALLGLSVHECIPLLKLDEKAISRALIEAAQRLSEWNEEWPGLTPIYLTASLAC